MIKIIIIYDKANGITSSFKGRLTRKPTKRGASETETNLGQIKSESTRSVVDVSIRVENIAEDEYIKLEKIFLGSNNLLDIEITDRGNYYDGYFISDTELNFEEKEDIETNGYYYIGGIQLKKR